MVHSCLALFHYLLPHELEVTIRPSSIDISWASYSILPQRRYIFQFRIIHSLYCVIWRKIFLTKCRDVWSFVDFSFSFCWQMIWSINREPIVSLSDWYCHQQQFTWGIQLPACDTVLPTRSLPAFRRNICFLLQSNHFYPNDEGNELLQRSVNMYQTIRRHNPEDCVLVRHHREDIKTWTFSSVTYAGFSSCVSQFWSGQIQRSCQESCSLCEMGFVLFYILDNAYSVAFC